MKISTLLKFHFVFFLACSLLPLFAWSADNAWDYSVSAGARNRPFGVSLNGELGFNHMVWGTRSADNVLYGFVRPAFQASTSVEVNSAGVGLHLYPVSFVRLSGGYAYSIRNTTLDTLDCTLVECTGSISQPYVEASVVLGTGKVFTTLSVGQRFLTPSLVARDFGEENSSLTGQAGGDRLTSASWIAGLQWDARWVLGLGVGFSRMELNRTINLNQSLFVRYRVGEFQILGGGGLYRSSTIEAVPVGFIELKWLPALSFEPA